MSDQRLPPPPPIPENLVKEDKEAKYVSKKLKYPLGSKEYKRKLDEPKKEGE